MASSPRPFFLKRRPGEQDSNGTVYTCTYCPMVTLVDMPNATRLVAVGGCTPSGCAGCNGIHISSASASSSGSPPYPHPLGSACSAGCIKHSDDGGKSWSQIRRFTDYGPGGMINYDRVSQTILLQFPDGHGLFSKHPGAILQISSTNFGTYARACSWRTSTHYDSSIYSSL